jgi:hypothetical protein
MIDDTGPMRGTAPGGRVASSAVSRSLLVLHQGENGRRRLVLGHGNDIVHILLA